MKNPVFCKLLALLFIAYKLAGLIDWSWWWITAPLWGSLILGSILDEIKKHWEA